VRKSFISLTNCITPVGFNVAANVDAIQSEVSGIKLHHDAALLPIPFHASVIEEEKLNEAFTEISSKETYTKLEKMLILSLQPLVEKSALNLNERTGFILSTTKGNITALENPKHLSQAYLHQLARTVADYFKFNGQPIVVSNACVSGIQAVSVAKRLIEGSVFDNIFIAAGDIVSKFVLSGFHSFKAMSMEPCKPFSKHRSGITLGEAAASVLVTVNRENALVEVIGAGSCNDANHISGPSRTGEGLFRSVESALKEAKKNSGQLDYISAHGTATLYNDEMEAIALNNLGLQDVPVNSFKGVYGHTLGASGLLEAVIGIQSVLDSKLYPSFGFDQLGVSQHINVVERTEEKHLNCFLKTASGFGGCNTAVVFEKTG
jgi:3-oxoacyl-[acyl-carrier-protein] synthase-1